MAKHKRTPKLYSHPRSGTNWLLALLEQAYWGCVKYAPAETGHWSQRVEVPAAPQSTQFWGGHQFCQNARGGKRIYLYRDGRDVALSLWRTKAFQHKSWRRLSFSEFLRRPLDWLRTPGRKTDQHWTIAEHWRRHLDSWHKAPGTLFVRYEDLLNDAPTELARIADFVDIELLLGVPLRGGAGPFPSSDYRAAKWRTVFTKAELDYFFTVVPPNHWGLWNE